MGARAKLIIKRAIKVVGSISEGNMAFRPINGGVEVFSSIKVKLL